MTDQELAFILSEGEGLFLEFKERPDRSIARELTAFANASGGKLLLGVTDDARVVGIQIDNRLKSQIQDAARNCDPPIPVELVAMGNVLVVDIAESPDKPHACSDGFFMRMGPNRRSSTGMGCSRWAFARGGCASTNRYASNSI